ncbi:DUF5994 family protein [Streptomyces scabiei]|uniref:Uncharacterized protein n=2 Tax=Streptomyces TaxID=1883 RepID=A0A100JVP7_STRSC|nr:DUF5994 family protein [Streptomyces scabiei]GAQ66551.1 hypothetical protein SsS58_06985 [Streptomyces scabiei]
MNAPTGRRASPDREPPSSLPAARLALRPPTFPPGPVSGAWWPRSDDLAAELPALIEAFDTSWGRVTRMAAHRGIWRPAPCDLPVTGHTVRAAWYMSGFDPHTVRLFAYGLGRRDLLVVPPGTEKAAAERLMRAATDRTCHLTASALLAL